MCVVSMVTNVGQKQWPHIDDWQQPIHKFKYWPTDTPTREEFEALKKAVEAAAELDRITNQPDCIDPDKQAWMEAVERRIDSLEAAAADSGVVLPQAVCPFDLEQFRADMERSARMLFRLDDLVPEANDLANTLVHWRNVISGVFK